MNHFLFDLFPVLLFFIVFKYYGIYAATWVGIIATSLQAVVYRLTKKSWDKMQLVTLCVFVLFGGMTLYFHNPIFVKWKPTIIFWIFGLVLLGSQFIGTKPLMQRFLEGALNNPKNAPKNAKQALGTIAIPPAVARKINLAWVIFFLVLGAVNVYVAYNYSDSTWVNFKLYGITVLTLIFSFGQSLFLMKYLKV